MLRGGRHRPSLIASSVASSTARRCPWVGPRAALCCAAMSQRTQRVLQDALELSRSERAEVASDLLASLDEEPDVNAEEDAAWAAELERRVKDAVENPDDGIPWETVRAELHSEPR